MRIKFLLLVLLILTSCTYKTSIMSPDGEVWEIRSKGDAMVEYVPPLIANAPTIKVDNRGKEGVIEGVLKLYMFDKLNREDAD